ncbi:sulfurtransferase-like selenium metabolism protein YedF [Natroniella sulfidigena]|uniref:sulfurtransferase-like selenium metabolism protein YedF n=1 Tax=Natroniella sulfidigena TaxID=723921 RepID=UPI00200A6933|nr:sulfurtransferase-like selenium metabolism protein YedF [Natroniella sulfidigena]MCK8816734.1 sulfurtransferase-like selenium metabolism protein YedF [Natroniella sulfidigena]
MKKIDARGMDCPQPVIETKNALQDCEELTVLIDNQVAADNVSKLAKKLGCKINRVEDGSDYKLILRKDSGKQEEVTTDSEKVYFIKTDQLGTGAEELGELLIKGFINTLLEVKPLPSKIIFINSGVKLATSNQEVKRNLVKLEAEDVDILACGMCLDYYGVKEDLEVGRISNMYEIVDILNQAEVVVV